MAFPLLHLGDLEVLEKRPRLDNGFDLLIQATIEGLPRYFAVRHHPASEIASGRRGTLAVCVPDTVAAMPAGPLEFQYPDDIIPSFIEAPIRRDLVSTLAELIAFRPKIARAGRNVAAKDLQVLNRDDRLAQQRQLRQQREWEIRDLAVLGDGRFAARLSCIEVEGLAAGTEHVVLVVPEFNPAAVAARSGFGGTIISTVEPPKLLKALQSEHHGQLAALLANIDCGWDCEADAIVDFDAAIAGEEIADRRVSAITPADSKPYGEDIQIAEQYDGDRPAYLLHTPLGWHVMETRPIGLSSRLQAKLAGDDKWVFLISPLRAARALLNQLPDRRGFNEFIARDKFTAVIEADLRRRLRDERCGAIWLIIRRAHLPEGGIAMMAVALPPIKLMAPPQIPRRSWVILSASKCEPDQADGWYVTDISTGAQLEGGYGARSVSQLRDAVLALGGTDDKMARRLLAEHFLIDAVGFDNRVAADQAWSELTGTAKTENIDEDASPVSTAVRQTAFDSVLATRRTEILVAADSGRIRIDDIAEAVRQLDQHAICPPQLMNLASQMMEGRPECQADVNRASGDVSTATKCDESHGEEGRDAHPNPMTCSGNVETAIDVIETSNVQHRRNSAANELVANKVCSPRGRPRIHADEAERKRIWAAKRRVAEREALGGAQIKCSGRPRKWGSDAERKAAWRAKQKK
ncbi:protein of unknown function [Magnetospirillum sp. XM-1]|uniref:hypothetical protein n=1 Tax=Magnetospirillum sp. XM-1 TaxID=1663591 RepID=UPI00073E0E12|nr:hypothetical protein [Magnetospirillum sp. XM-1]CUW40813.1 protein of unknown function [Magnetospirillum sp. XM-1]